MAESLGDSNGFNFFTVKLLGKGEVVKLNKWGIGLYEDDGIGCVADGLVDVGRSYLETLQPSVRKIW